MCDLGKPTCAQCKKVGLQCEGYGARRVFVVSTPDSRHIGYSVNINPLASGSTWHRDPPNSLSTETTNLRLLARPEDERRCIDIFWEAFFPSGSPITTDAVRSYTCTWTESARKLYTEDPSLRFSLWANCLLLTGKRYGTAWMLRESSRSYGKALTCLRRSLSMPRASKRDSLIATVKLLNMFELFSQQQNEGQTADQSQKGRRHHAGELALFIARSPGAHIDGDAHHVFADERMELALSAILQRKELALSTPEWKSIPWRKIPKDLKDVLVDVLVDLPRLVQYFDEMRLCTEPSRQAALRSDLIDQCWEHDRRLSAWSNLVRQVVERQGPPIPQGPSPANRRCAESRPKDTVTLIARVHGMCLFWTISLVLYTILRTASDPQAKLLKHTDPLLHAHSLTEAIRSLLQPEAGLYGRQSAALPLEVALQYTAAMSPSSAEAEALVETLKQLKIAL